MVDINPLTATAIATVVTVHPLEPALDSDGPPVAAVIAVVDSAEFVWACITCTFNNKAGNSQCEMCGTSNLSEPMHAMAMSRGTAQQTGRDQRATSSEAESSLFNPEDSFCMNCVRAPTHKHVDQRR